MNEFEDFAEKKDVLGQEISPSFIKAEEVTEKPEKIAILRTLIKILLGWLSFVTVTFNVNRRAIHDFASGSIMISNRIK